MSRPVTTKLTLIPLKGRSSCPLAHVRYNTHVRMGRPLQMLLDNLRQGMLSIREVERSNVAQHLNFLFRQLSDIAYVESEQVSGRTILSRW